MIATFALPASYYAPSLDAELAAAGINVSMLVQFVDTGQLRIAWDGDDPEEVQAVLDAHTGVVPPEVLAAMAEREADRAPGKVTRNQRDLAEAFMTTGAVIGDNQLRRMVAQLVRRAWHEDHRDGGEPE